MRGNHGISLLILFFVLTTAIVPASAEKLDTYSINFSVESGESTELPDVDKPPVKEKPTESSGGGGGFYMPPASAENNSITNETNVTTTITEPVTIVEPEPPRVQPPVTEPEAIPAEPSAMTASDALLPGAIKVGVAGLGIAALLTIVYVSRSFISSMWSRKGKGKDDEEQLEK